MLRLDPCCFITPQESVGSNLHDLFLGCLPAEVSELPEVVIVRVLPSHLAAVRANVAHDAAHTLVTSPGPRKFRLHHGPHEPGQEGICRIDANVVRPFVKVWSRSLAHEGREPFQLDECLLSDRVVYPKQHERVRIEIIQRFLGQQILPLEETQHVAPELVQTFVPPVSHAVHRRNDFLFYSPCDLILRSYGRVVHLVAPEAGLHVQRVTLVQVDHGKKPTWDGTPRNLQVCALVEIIIELLLLLKVCMAQSAEADHLVPGLYIRLRHMRLDQRL
mmetsp:Transcript_47004/g.84811  ORF Transcript_47004/g.84811 Transcript_47004/m.84811 type:complete len:275 (-) Transcript_47004:115-939(-)